MSGPSPSAAIQRPQLDATFMEWSLEAERMGYIGYRALPVFESARQSGTFGKIPIEQLVKRSTDIKRASGGGYSRQEYTFTSDNFVCEEYGAEELIDDRNAAIYRNFFDAEVIARNRAMARVMREIELEIKDAIFNTTTWTGASLTTGVSTEWDTYASAKPIDDVLGAKQLVRSNSGLEANAVIGSIKVFENALNCDQIKDQVKYWGGDDPKALSLQALAALFKVDYVIAGGVYYDTANQGQTTSLSDVWDDEYVMVCRIATSQDMAEPCIGRVIHWGGDGSSAAMTVESYRDESKRSDVIRARTDIDVKMLYTEAGHLLSNITA